MKKLITTIIKKYLLLILFFLYIPGCVSQYVPPKPEKFPHLYYDYEWGFDCFNVCVYGFSNKDTIMRSFYEAYTELQIHSYFYTGPDTGWTIAGFNQKFWREIRRPYAEMQLCVVGHIKDWDSLYPTNWTYTVGMEGHETEPGHENGGGPYSYTIFAFGTFMWEAPTNMDSVLPVDTLYHVGAFAIIHELGHQRGNLTHPEDCPACHSTSWCVMMKGIPMNYDSTFIEGYYRFCSECESKLRAVDWDSLLKDYR
ncbi:hypothetical protein DRQ23_08670 [bacterium]|nr:MAG: hypothetical protein DRQ23_08670 [bacterium]